MFPDKNKNPNVQHNFYKIIVNHSDFLLFNFYTKLLGYHSVDLANSFFPFH